MIYTAFIYALRNLKRNKLSSLINIFGFSIGIAAFLLIVSYIKFEKESDNFYTDGDNIYRIGINFINNENVVKNSMVQFPVAQALKNEFPEIKEYARMWGNYNIVVKFGDKEFHESKIYNVDESFPNMFCEMTIGNAETCLVGGNNAIISEEIAVKYFGNENPIGKEIQVKEHGVHKVTGVFKNRGNKSHFDFEILLPLRKIGTSFTDDWGSHGFYTYIKLKDGTNQEAFTNKVNEMINVRYADDLYTKTRIREKMFLTPINEIRLYTDLLLDFKRNGHGYYIPFFVLTAIIIILFAMFNYFNFASSQAVEKSRTVGINRVLGAGKQTIIRMFLVESFVFIFISTLIGAILALLLFPTFSAFYGLTFEYSLVTSSWFWGYLAAIIVITTIVSGIYPAILSFSFKISEVLRGRSKVSHSGIRVIKLLTILQYTISCLLIIFSLVSYNQIEFMKDHDLGFDKEDVLVAREPVILKENITHRHTYGILKNAIDRIPEVTDLSFADYVPGGIYEKFDMIKMEGSDEVYETYMNSISFNFIDFFKIKLLSGRHFDKTRLADYQEAVIINKKLAVKLGFTPEEAIDKQILFGGKKKIIGVVDDFHQESLKKETAPYLFYQSSWPGYYCFKVNKNNLPATIDRIEEEWNTLFPGNPFNYFFLDKYFDANYVKDNKAWQILRFYSALAIIIAVLGLLGAIVHQVKQRRKDIAMYKVLGADRWSILWIFLKGTLYLVGISFLIGLPIQIFVLREWLAEFPYRISLNILHFLIPLTILIIITFLTISSQVFKVISSNLVSSLRSE
ncbi:ABC transporter permease [Tenacibaculum agarivorans]|uniref:ABC transporter permease n=1 Tax=Tenacibaculum agarivorans TaxID=1908389 RepID=UPI00094BA2D2|nr:ABC transporter permease [Tenacibaculum agarivorans]